MAPYEAPFPHCDSDVLHAPGECIYCDHFPERQEERRRNHINFTGHGTDPATARRPLERINLWHGNIPMTVEQQRRDDESWGTGCCVPRRPRAGW